MSCRIVAARGHRHAPIDIDGVRPAIVAAVEHKTDLGLDRTAEKMRTCLATRSPSHRSQEVCQGTLPERSIDDQAERRRPWSWRTTTMTVLRKRGSSIAGEATRS